MNDYFNKIYYINLDRDNNKKEYFEKEIKKSQLIKSYDRFSAVDGRSLDLNTIDDKTITNSARKDILTKRQRTYGISLTYGSLGCAISHKKIFEECKDSNKSFLIFEDDIIIDQNFDSLFNNILIYIKNINYDIVYLGYNEIPGFKKNIIDNTISKASGLITGLYGYIVSPIGAQKLLNIIFPLNKQIDSSISDNSQKLNLYCSTSKIIGVSTKFGSKTQKEKSCENIMDQTDSWYKLFQ